MNNEDILTTMFAVHGKRPMDAQFDEYLKIFDKLGSDKSYKLFKHVRDDEDRFPTIKQLWGIINSMGLINKEQSQLKSYDDCYFCGGVGYVPRMLSPKQDKRVVYYNTEMYACKCSAGQDLPKSYPKYFEQFNELQFKEVREGTNYPQLVSQLQIEFNEKLHKESEKGNGNRNGNSKSKRADARTGGQNTSGLGAKELREALKKITG
tara:strand:+ start:74 stop:694 length:621 start_codon:yes stop_codon:yes gene_type:complete